MIIARTPLRIPIAGGGTDLPSFYKKHGSLFISAAIDSYIYVLINKRSLRGIRLVHSKIEETRNIKEINHQIIRAALNLTKIQVSKGLEIVSIGDLPAGSGMGSSGSFTVGLLNSLYYLLKKPKRPLILAEEASYINMHLLKKSSGIQDEYISAIGGITCFAVNKNGGVKVFPLNITKKTLLNLNRNLLMFYTGLLRNSNFILNKHSRQIVSKRNKMTQNLIEVQKVAYEIKKALEDGNTNKFGMLMDKHWELKRMREGTTSSKIDYWYNLAKTNGAIGGKIMGAGGGGFFLFYCEKNKNKLIKTMLKEGMEKIEFNFDFEGTRIIANN